MTKRKLISRTAEAFLFSGRPNPQWRLSKAQMKEWNAQWDEAPLSDNKVERPAILGYTGCLLQNEEHSYWIIYNGCLSFYSGDKMICKIDEGRQLERWLLNTGPEEMKKVVSL